VRDHVVHSIVEAKPSDATQLSKLAIRSKAIWGYDASFMQACEKELSYSAEKILAPNYHFYVAKKQNDVLGFYALQALSETQAELEALFVEPEWIGKGIGRTLIQHAIGFAKNQGCNSLIIQGDPHAEKFYRAAGGKNIGERESDSIPGRYLPVFEIFLNKNK